MQKIDAWYTTSKTCIPPNVIECGDTIRHFRNVIRHTADTGWKNNTSFLMLKAMVLNLFEIIRVLGTDIQYDKKNKKWWISYISKIQ